MAREDTVNKTSVRRESNQWTIEKFEEEIDQPRISLQNFAKTTVAFSNLIS